MLIDNYLPSYDVNEIHTIIIDADSRQVYRTLRSFDLNNSFPVRFLFLIRSLPAILRHPTNPHRNKLGTTFESLQKSGFILLADNPPEEFVLGLVGKFWTPSGSIQKMSAGEFSAFNSPGYTKAIWNFCLRKLPDGRTLLSTETRVTCTDDVSRKKFMRYWFFVRPFSGLIRKEALRIIQHNAEQQPSLVAENFP